MCPKSNEQRYKNKSYLLRAFSLKNLKALPLTTFLMIVSKLYVNVVEL
jgi:hypothetical protein